MQFTSYSEALTVCQALPTHKQQWLKRALLELNRAENFKEFCPSQFFVKHANPFANQQPPSMNRTVLKAFHDFLQAECDHTEGNYRRLRLGKLYAQMQVKRGWSPTKVATVFEVCQKKVKRHKSYYQFHPKFKRLQRIPIDYKDWAKHGTVLEHFSDTSTTIDPINSLSKEF